MLCTLNMKPQFELGEVVGHLANRSFDIVIIKIKKRFFNRPRKYKVRLYDNNRFNTGIVFEHELFHK